MGPFVFGLSAREVYDIEPHKSNFVFDQKLILTALINIYKFLKKRQALLKVF
jgi:hypothetical protein